VALEGDPEDRVFLVWVGTNYRKGILVLSRGKGEGLIVIASALGVQVFLLP
jgi:hypothetical protein